MRGFGEKMRQISVRLKSAGNGLARTAQGGARDAARLWQKTRQWPVDWWAARHGSSPSAAESAWDGANAEAAVSAGGGAANERRGGAVWRDRHPRFLKILRIAGIAAAAYLVMPYPMILIYRFVDPPISIPMLRDAITGREIKHDWVDFADISPNLARAVVIAEDAAFCSHWGVDWNAVGEALEDMEDGDRPRGASTIAMQTAKNLFLGSEQAYIRKALEVPLAYFMTFVWPKQRVLEVYLNIAEWGPGIYGAEAAARYHFGKPARSLTRTESALLAAALPSPLKRNAGRPSARMQLLAGRIQDRVDRESQDAACIFDG